MRERIAVAFVAGMLVTTATLKLTGTSGHGVLQFHPVLGVSVALAEYAIAGTLIARRTRRVGAVAATVLLLLGGAYVALSPAFTLPRCGCLGGHVELGVGWHVLLIGVSLFLLAEIAVPSVGERN